MEKIVSGDYCPCIKDFGGGKNAPVARRGFYKKEVKKAAVFAGWQTVIKRDEEAFKRAQGLGVDLSKGPDVDASGDTGTDNIACVHQGGTAPAGKCDEKAAHCDDAVVARPGAMTKGI